MFTRKMIDDLKEFWAKADELETQLFCTNAPDLYFYEKGDNPSVESKMAKALCAQCPLVNECLMFALEHNEESGVWGGKTPRERDVIRRQMGLKSFSSQSIY